MFPLYKDSHVYITTMRMPDSNRIGPSTLRQTAYLYLRSGPILSFVLKYCKCVHYIKTMDEKFKKCQKVIEMMYSACTLKDALANCGVSSNMFYLTLETHPILHSLYERAQKYRGEIFADEIIKIADEEVDAQKARNRIDARKWYASKMQPQKYGERIDLNVNQTVDIGAALSEARSRLPSKSTQESAHREVNEISNQNKESGTSGSQPVAPESSSEDIFD